MKKIIFLSSLVFFVFNVHMAQAHSVVTPVNLNTADIKQLETLKGIGMKKAQLIVASRQHRGNFHSVNELTRIRGIGQRFLGRLLKMNKGRLVVTQKS